MASNWNPAVVGKNLYSDLNDMTDNQDFKIHKRVKIFAVIEGLVGVSWLICGILTLIGCNNNGLYLNFILFLSLTPMVISPVTLILIIRCPYSVYLNIIISLQFVCTLTSLCSFVFSAIGLSCEFNGQSFCYSMRPDQLCAGRLVILRNYKEKPLIIIGCVFGVVMSFIEIIFNIIISYLVFKIRKQSQSPLAYGNQPSDGYGIVSPTSSWTPIIQHSVPATTSQENVTPTPKFDAEQTTMKDAQTPTAIGGKAGSMPSININIENVNQATTDSKIKQKRYQSSSKSSKTLSHKEASMPYPVGPNMMPIPHSSNDYKTIVPSSVTSSTPYPTQESSSMPGQTLVVELR